VSLFEDNRFVYRDTFFVYLQDNNRPQLEQVKSALAELGDKYELGNARDNDGKFESITVYSPQDYSAMDITFVRGEEVLEQIKEMMNEFKLMTLSGDDRKKLEIFEKCDVRLDVFHFEQVSEAQEGDEILDPGGLLLVMESLANLCHGVSLDPQSQTLL
jgi:hypothetical protein